MKEIKKEEIDGINSNTFPLFSQNSLVCRYGFLTKYGKTVSMAMLAIGVEPVASTSAQTGSKKCDGCQSCPRS